MDGDGYRLLNAVLWWSMALALIALRLTGIIAWPWAVVLMPFWLPISLATLVVGILLVFFWLSPK